jgi:hypothetical protein
MNETPTIDTTPLDRARPAIVIHTALRRELRLAGPLVRAVADGDTGRSARVADHLRVVLGVLHHHHENEDQLAFPPLRGRLDADREGLVALMEDQHAALVGSLDAAEAVLPRWAEGARAADGAALASALEALHTALVEHLDAEERFVLPLAERLLTEAEWEAIGEHGEKGAQGPDKLLVLGMLVHEGDPATIAAMLAAAPRPVRWLLPRIARRTYRRHARAIHGTPTP